MMNSATSSRTKDDSAAFSLWQIYALLGMLAAAAAVWISRNTHPLALVLLSATAIAAGMVALTVHRAVDAFLSRGEEAAPMGERRREVLEKEKALVLRSIKELEFDKAMGKVGEVDFTAISSRLRARALALMQDLERTAAAAATEREAAAATKRRRCAGCGTPNEPDAKFCKNCGRGLRN